MSQHRIKVYLDGHKKIEYCTVCGKEALELVYEQECIVDKKNEDQTDFLIDKPNERT